MSTRHLPVLSVRSWLRRPSLALLAAAIASITSISAAQSRIEPCGLYVTCPAGYHSTRREQWAGCGASVGTAHNRVTCERDEGASFVTCDAACPTGYHNAGVASGACINVTRIDDGVRCNRTP